jgi:hypothetical protein
MRHYAALFVLLLSAALLLPAQEHGHAQHEKEKKDRLAEVNRRGANVMGFDQDNSTHQFHLTTRGGYVEVRANDPNDADTIRRIQRHLSDIAKEFGRQDFARPEIIHDGEVPGTQVLKKKEMKDKVTYRFRKSPVGGRLEINTADSDAIRAVHEFLRFQIADHQTGDAPHVH